MWLTQKVIGGVERPIWKWNEKCILHCLYSMTGLRNKTTQINNWSFFFSSKQIYKLYWEEIMSLFNLDHPDTRCLFASGCPRFVFNFLIHFKLVCACISVLSVHIPSYLQYLTGWTGQKMAPSEAADIVMKSALMAMARQKLSSMP